MKLTRRATTLALVLSGASAVPAFAQGAQGASGTPKIAYIDSKVVLSRAPGRQQAEDQFNKEMEASRAQVQKMGDSLQTMIADYQKAQATLAQNIREQREAAIRKKQEDYQSRAGTLDQQMQQRQMELVKPIMDQIRKVLDDIRQEEGFAFILDAGSEAGGSQSRYHGKGHCATQAGHRLGVAERQAGQCQVAGRSAPGASRGDAAKAVTSWLLRTRAGGLPAVRVFALSPLRISRNSLAAR